jgi:hypothetical protein
MPFTVYPDAATSALLGTPANTPVPLAAGAMFSAFAPLAADSGPDPSEFNLQTTFIRISMSLPASATPPQIELEAHNPTAGTTGPSVIISAMSFPGQSLNDGTNPTDAATAYFLPPYSNNVYLLKVVTEISGTTFLMRITNNTAAAHDFVWVVADSDANSQQPWIQVSPTSLAYTALENQTATQTAQSLQINNRGTGSMTVSTITPSIAAPYAVNSGLPATVAPNPATPLPSIVIGFNAPGTIQTLAATNYTTDGDPGAVTGAGRNNAFSLSANTTGLEVVMMLDDSGSMAATDTTSGSTRLNELQSAAKLFLDDLAAFGAASGTIGVLMFPGTDPNNPTDLASYNLQRATQIPADMTAIKNLINPLVPVDNTPMDYCIQDLFAATAPPYFAVDAASIAHNRRWMLLMSDGQWNVGPDPNTEVSNLGGKNIVVFSAGYGQSGQVDYATLTNLATGSGSAPGGQALQVDVGAGYSALQLANKFKAAIKAGLTSVNSPGDPTSTIFPGQVQQFEMIITKYDTKAVFSINWDTPNLPLSLELLSPTCDLITPQAAANTPGLKFNSDSRYQMYVVDGSYLRNDANPTSPRFGVWRMVVTYNNPILEAAAVPAAVNLGQPFSYDVLTESSLRLDVSLDQSVYYAGDTIGVTAKLTANGLPVTGAAVQLSVTAPSQSMDNWLAGIPISAAEYAAAARALAAKDASAIYIKAFAVQTKGIKFVNVPVQTTIPMSDPTNSGIYTATVNQTTIPDGHTLYVTATGTTSDGVAFRRDRSVEVRVVVRPDPVFTIFNIQYDPFTSSTAPVTGTITVTPRDRFGNVVLIDPATSKYLALQATGATLGQALTTAFDGSYATTLSYAPGARPTISLTAGGVTVSNHVPVPPADQLEYVDEVITFVPGMAAAAGANQHGNPGDVLGDIRQKAANLFVSLGAYGSITVGIKGQVILARADDDVTVFVEPDVNLRSYLVEASPAGSASGWVKLGQSDGYSASFSLKAADLTAASAIRITDTSGITRDASHSPSPTPGVSIRGVGVASSASAVNVIGGYERLFIGFFSNGGVASVANFPSRFISKIDGYQYKQSEVSYEYFLHSTRKPAQGFVQGQLTPPAPANANSGAGDLLYMLWDVDDATGTVSLNTSFYVDGKQETPTNDGCVKVYAICQRSSA